jgi:hypothetical protein
MEEKEVFYRSCYEKMLPEEKERNFLAVSLDLVIGGKAELLLELLGYLDFDGKNPSLELRHIVEELKEEMGI